MQDAKFRYYRECPFCGHMEEVTEEPVGDNGGLSQPFAQPPMGKINVSNYPIAPRMSPDKIEDYNEDGGGVSAEFR